MNEWTCPTCGTHNQNPIDATIERINESHSWGASPARDMLDNMMKRNREIENRGEIPIERCTRCKVVRI